MSTGRTVDHPIPHDKAWPLEARRQTMRDFVAMSARMGRLDKIKPEKVAQTFGSGKILACEVEAEIMKYPQEDCGK